MSQAGGTKPVWELPPACPREKRGARKQGHRNGGSCRTLSHILPGLGKCDSDCHPYPQEESRAEIQKGQGRKSERDGVLGVSIKGTREGVGDSLILPLPRRVDPTPFSRTPEG